MTRPKKTDLPDLAKAHELTAGRIERLTCPPGKPAAFLRDNKAPGLRVRVTAGGAKSFVFESKLDGRFISRTIGDTRAWTIERARKEAHDLRVLLDQGTDPRELDRAARAEKAAIEQAANAATLSVAEAWSAYIAERRPHWGERHYQDHIAKAAAGGIPAKRGKKLGEGAAPVTTPGPLHALMLHPLRDRGMGGE
jgi:hypothetical protein